MHWPAHLAQCPQQFNAAKLLGNHNVRLGNHRRTCLIVWPNPSAACDFAVRGSVEGAKTVRNGNAQTRCAQESAPEHQTQPPQTTGNQVAITGANWVTIDLAAIPSLGDAQSYHLAPLPALLLVQTLLSNDVTRLALRLDQTTQHSVVVLEMRLLMQTHHPQNRTHRSFPRC